MLPDPGIRVIDVPGGFVAVDLTGLVLLVIGVLLAVAIALDVAVSVKKLRRERERGRD